MSDTPCPYKHGEFTNAVIYRCNQCGQWDRDRGFYSTPAQAIHCWNCGSGRGSKSWMQMVESREGMFPVTENNLYPWEQ